MSGIIVGIILCVICFSKLKSYKSAVSVLCAALGEEEVAEIVELAKEAEQIEKEMANGVIKEYESKKREISSKYDAEIKRITSIYDAEIRRIKEQASRLKNEANRNGDVHGMSSATRAGSIESQALIREKNAQIEPLRKEKASLLKELNEEYKPDLAQYKKVKELKSGSKLVVKLVNNAIKKENK